MTHNKPKETRVAIYIRVSTLHQIDKDSLPMQKKDLLAYAKLILDTDNCIIFEDAGYSGKNTVRPNYQKMMTQIRAGLFSHLLVWKIDRISRNLLDFAVMYNELKELGVIFVSKNEQFDTSTAMGEAMLKIILVFAELERNMTSERVTATMISRANNGQWTGGRIPYGYNWNSEKQEFTLNNQECQVVKYIHEQYEKEQSLIRLTRIMNSKGYKTRVGGEWNHTSIFKILRSIFYCGDYLYNVSKNGCKLKDESEWITIPNHHIAIIDREQKNRIIAILDSNRYINKQKNNYNSSKYTHVFSGLCICGVCKKPMGASPTSVKSNGQRYSKYACPTARKNVYMCNNKTTSDPVIGEFVLNYILNILNAQRNFKNIDSKEILQAYLLSGDTFYNIEKIDSEGLDDLYNMLSLGVTKGEIFGKSTNSKQSRKSSSELNSIQAEKQKIERALDRLRNLYLYSEDAMSEKEYLLQKEILLEKLEEINEEIGLLQADTWPITDEIFIIKASEFIITQKLTNRNYVNYKLLVQSVDAKVLHNFLISIIDSITITHGKIEKIIFKNGLSHSFIFKKSSA